MARRAVFEAETPQNSPSGKLGGEGYAERDIER